MPRESYLQNSTFHIKVISFTMYVCKSIAWYFTYGMVSENLKLVFSEGILIYRNSIIILQQFEQKKNYPFNLSGWPLPGKTWKTLEKPGIQKAVWKTWNFR